MPLSFKNDSKKGFIELLEEKIGWLFRQQDYHMVEKGSRMLVGQLIKTIAQKGFLRTHAFIVNWVEELFKEGELSRKSLQKICSELPWSWDQTKKYCDALEKEGMLTYTRDSTGKKICSLTLEAFFLGDKTKHSSQLLRLVYFLKHHRRTLPQKQLAQLKGVLTQYYSKVAQLEELKLRIKKAKTWLLPAEEGPLHQLAEEIAKAYWFSRDNSTTVIVKRVMKLLAQKPALVFSLQAER